MKHHGTDTCVMREDHVGKPADHGLMCEECRAEDRAIHTPHRVQLSRKKGWKMPANTVSVARPGRWGNPFKVGSYICSGQGEDFTQVKVETRADAVTAFRDMLTMPIRCYPFDEEIEELRGKNLACWCPLDQPCHADVLLLLANDNRPRTIFSDDVDPAARGENHVQN